MPMFKRSMVILVLILALGAGISIYHFCSEEGYDLQEEIAAVQAKNQGDDEAQQIGVYVTGEVANPGVVYLSSNSRVIDAVAKCGGLLETAAEDKVNMAQLLKDGMQVKVPAKASSRQSSGGGQAVGYGKSGTAQAEGSSYSSSGGSSESNGSYAGPDGDLVNINTADAAGLEKLKGIGPAMAQRIVEYREVNGDFQAVEDLMKVKGIGQAKFAKLQDQITL